MINFKSNSFINVLMKSVSFFLFCILILVLSSNAKGPDALFMQANDAYSKQNYDQAIKVYDQILSEGFISAGVFYNLGNCYYKTQDYASAILNYERAKKLAPADDDISYNLKLANMQIVDKIEPAPKVFYEKWWERLLSSTTSNSSSRTGLILIYFAVALFIGYIFIRRIVIRKVAFFASVVILFFGVVFIFVASRQHNYLDLQKQAIIFSTNEYVKSSPELNGKNLFMLHAGTKVDVMDELTGWKKIKIANGNQGWIQAEAIKEI